MEYLLFTLPNCDACEAMKTYLKGTELDVAEYNLIQKDSKRRVREFLGDLKRDNSGAIIIPTLIILEEGNVAAVLNTHEELDNWLKSRA